MGTNFYIKGHRDSDEPKYHIGKRSAAGLYCWKCRTTLCKDGKSEIHSGPKDVKYNSGGFMDIKDYNEKENERWYDKCPHCGLEPEKENLENSSSGRELGFNKNCPQKKIGVSSCSSFTWARRLTPKIKLIEDEYGQIYTRKEFDKVLEECPIQFELLGVEFS